MNGVVTQRMVGWFGSLFRAMESAHDMRVLVITRAVADDLGRDLAVEVQPSPPPLAETGWLTTTWPVASSATANKSPSLNPMIRSAGPGLADEGDSFSAIMDILIFPGV
ncbi:hypothetical protein WP1_138 [Pseudomonas phage WP1]